MSAPYRLRWCIAAFHIEIRFSQFFSQGITAPGFSEGRTYRHHREQIHPYSRMLLCHLDLLHSHLHHQSFSNRMSRSKSQHYACVVCCRPSRSLMPLPSACYKVILTMQAVALGVPCKEIEFVCWYRSLMSCSPWFSSVWVTWLPAHRPSEGD